MEDRVREDLEAVRDVEHVAVAGGSWKVKWDGNLEGWGHIARIARRHGLTKRRLDATTVLLVKEQQQ